MKIGIGIDTGGTCTDAVALDLTSGQVLAKGKTETTREDLSIGISKALDALPQDYICSAEIISLSTTLATNACIEGKGCRAKLVLFGLPEEYLIRMHAPENYNLMPENVLCIDTHGSADGLYIDEPDWDELFEKHGNWLRDSDALCAVELYSDDNGAPCEKKFKTLVKERLGIKCVSANELTSGINVFARGSTALLNARLFPIVSDFVNAAERDFRKRGCNAPIMIVRSDASLMSDELTMSRPVETILSGPAASVLAGKNFSDCNDYVVVDMGGTSTDISVVSGGRPQTADQGISIAEWATSVKGIKVYPFNLGGDSAVRLYQKQPQLFPRRVRSVCSAAAAWPEIKDKLRALLLTGHHNHFPMHEFFYLVHEPENAGHFSEKEQKLLTALRKGPLLLERLGAEAGIDIYGLDSERLESEGIIMRIGLTPTDFMHIKGDYLEYDREASVLAARYMLQGMDLEDSDEEVLKLADIVYDLVEEKMFENILQMALQRRFPAEFKGGIDPQTEFLIRQTWRNRKVQGTELLRQSFDTDYTLIGIGAPTHIFMPEVAQALNADYILPEHAEIANAIGALRADLSVIVRVGISEHFIFEEGRSYYIVHDPNGSKRFNDADKALEFARRAGKEAAEKEALARGAKGEIKLSSNEEHIMVTSKTGAKVKMGRVMVTTAEI